VAVRATSGKAGRAALQHAEALLASRGHGEDRRVEVPLRSIASAARRTVEANVAMVSVPGEYAVAEAHQALAAGLHVFLFSDGVPLGDELALKQTALHCTEVMDEITLSENEAYRIPVLNFRGTPTGIDVRLVVQTGELPQIKTGIAHRRPGIGQIGAGLVKPPRACFEAALCALAAERRRG
jgi:hypothetical protein